VPSAFLLGANGPPECVEASAPADDELHALLQIIIARPMKMLTRPGVRALHLRDPALPGGLSALQRCGMSAGP
jgi:hypothetical protein